MNIDEFVKENNSYRNKKKLSDKTFEVSFDSFFVLKTIYY